MTPEQIIELREMADNPLAANRHTIRAAVKHIDAQEARIAELAAELADTRETYESMFAEAGRDAEKYRAEIATLEADRDRAQQWAIDGGGR